MLLIILLTELRPIISFLYNNYTYEITAKHTSQGIPLNPKENSEDRNSINLQDGIRSFL